MQKGEKGYEGSVWDDGIPERARTATLDIFATDESASVQVRFFSFFSFVDKCNFIFVG